MKTSKRNLLQRFKQLNRPKKLSIFALGLFIVYIVSGFFIIPPIARLVLEKKLPLLLHREVSIEKVRLNPLTLSASIEGFSIRHKNSPEQFLGFDQLGINFQAVSLFKQAIIIKSAAVSGPKINFSKIADNKYDFSDLIPKGNENTDKTTSTEPLSFSINNIEIKGGEIQFFDQPKEKRHHIAKLNMAVASISNLPYDIEHFIQPSFSALVNGTPFKLEGHAKPFAKSRETGVDIDIKDFDIVNYLNYIPNPTQATLTSCLVDITGTMNFSNGKGSVAGAQLSYAGKIIFKDATIANKAGKDFIHFPEIAIHMAASNILAQKFHISKLLMTAPGIQIQRTKDLEILPFSFIMPMKQEQQTPVEKAQKDIVGEGGEATDAFRLDIDNLLLNDGHVSFRDESVNDFTTQITPINIQLKNFSTAKEKKGQFELSLTSEAHETVASSGGFQLTPFLADGSIALTDMSFVKYMPYAKSYILPELTSGLLSVSSDFSVSEVTPVSQDLLFTDIAVSIERLIAQESGKSIFALPEFNLSGGTVILAEKRVDLGEIISKQASITVIQDAHQQLNLSSFLKETEGPDSDTKDEQLDTEIDSSQNATTWQLTLHSADMSDYEILFMDQSLAAPADLRLHEIDLKVANFSTVEDAQSKLDFSGYLNESGKITARGEFGVLPLFLTLEMDCKDLAFKPFQSYVDEYLYLLINSGSLSSAGTFSLESEKAQSRFHFKGVGSIDNLAIIDTRLNEDIMSWEKINFNDISFDSSPLSVTIGGVHLQAPFAKISVSDRGRLSLTELVKNSAVEPQKSKTTSEQQPPSTGAKGITVKEVSVTGGSLEFVDHSITPSYSASLTEFTGEVAGLSSVVDSRAEVDFKGKLNKFSPVQISGLVNPLAERFFADLKIEFHDIDLSPTSPYTGKYLGYKTDKGKLTLNLHYLVDDKEIEAQNHAFLDQFTLGDSVDSPDAADLPIRLAIALLQNRAGEINLDIPVQGNLDDPEFSVAGVVAKVIFNLIAKAVTSPFALLGALIPDGEDLQYIPFAPGKADIPPEQLDKLSQIISVLYDRPGLRMDIVGKIASEEDRKALQEMRLNTMLKLQKIKEQVGGEPKDELSKLESTIVNAEEYSRYLELVYRTRNVLKDTSSQKKDIPPEKPSLIEMKEQLLAGITVPNEDLRLLAHTRAANVKDHLLASGKVEAERLFLVEPQISSAQEGAEEIDASDMVMQVELVIK